MTDDMYLPAERSAGPDAYFDEPAQEEGMERILREFRRLLHGRWLWAIGLGLLFGAGAAYVGYGVPKPIYRSMAVVGIKPRAPRVLYSNDLNELMPMFDSYVEEQAQLIISRRVINMVMDSEEWKSLGIPANDAAIARISGSLSTKHSMRRQHILVHFDDIDARVAQVGCRQVVAAFLKIHDDEQNKGGHETRNLLEERRLKLKLDLSRLRDEILEATRDLGVNGLESQYKFELERHANLKDAANGVEIEVAALDRDTPQVPDAKPVKVSPEVIALSDGNMDRLLKDKYQQETRLDYLKKVLKRGPAHTDVIIAGQELGKIERQIEDRAAAWIAQNGDTVDPSVAKKKELEARLRRLQSLAGESEDAIKSIARRRNDVLKLEDERTTTNMRLAEVDARIDEMSVESLISGRVSVLSDAERPVGAYKDRRAAVGLGAGLLGMAGGFGLVILFALCNRRVRSLMDIGAASDSRRRILGVLPNFEDGVLPGENASVANHCIHRIRTLLELHSLHAGRVVAVTSAAAGAGKTTLSFALGLSYGETGSRTLLIDCDLVGRGLTTCLKTLIRRHARRSLLTDDVGAAQTTGSVSGLLLETRPDSEDADQPDLDELLEQARELETTTEMPMGDLVRMLDVLATQEELERRRAGNPPVNGTNGNGHGHGSRGVNGDALRAVSDPSRAVGLLDVLDGIALEDCVVSSGIPNLDVLTVGRADEHDTGKLSAGRIRRLLEIARAGYDHVVIDTGPILGSLEATFVVSAADAVVLAVSKGDLRPLSNDAFDRLDELGANTVGAVLNRAEPSDVLRSSFSHYSTYTRSTPPSERE